MAAIDAEATRAQKTGRTAREAPSDGHGAQRGKRRAAPATGGVTTDEGVTGARRRQFDLGGHCVFALEGAESWDIIGQPIRLHNSFWGWDDGAYSECQVVAYAGEYTFAAGKRSKHTYIIECEGHYYPATHDAVADALTDATVKRRIRKAGPPRLL